MSVIAVVENAQLVVERRPKILLVGADEELLFAMHRALYADNLRYDVLLSSNGAVARVILRDQLIDVVVADADSSASAESDLVAWVCRESSHTRIILLIEMDVDDVARDGFPSTSVRLLGKPFDPQELRALVRDTVDPVEALSGKLSTMPFADIVQLLCAAGKSASVHVQTGDGAAVVLVANGQIVHAERQGLVGVDVLTDLIGLRHGTFRLGPFPEEHARTIVGKWRHLLMEAARRLDERDRSSSRAPETGPDALGTGSDAPETGPDALGTSSVALELELSEFSRGTSQSLGRPVPSVAPASQARPRESTLRPVPFGTAAALVDEGFAALRAGDRLRAQSLWSEALQRDPTNRTLALNLRKLAEMGRSTG